MPKISAAGGATYNEPRPGGEPGELVAVQPEWAGSEPDTLDNRSYAPPEPAEAAEPDQAQREAEHARGRDESWDGGSSPDSPKMTGKPESSPESSKASPARTTESPTSKGQTDSRTAPTTGTGRETSGKK